MKKTANNHRIVMVREKVALINKQIEKIDAEIRKLESRKRDLRDKRGTLGVKLATSCLHKKIRDSYSPRQGIPIQICKKCGCSRRHLSEQTADGSWSSMWGMWERHY